MTAPNHSKSEFKLFEPCTQQNMRAKYLDVHAMTDPFINNYNDHVNIFIEFLKTRLSSSRLVYEGSTIVYNHILDRTTYACSVRKGNRILKDVFPVMIGSRLDLAIRHRGKKDFNGDIDEDETAPCQTMDIARGFFLICGYVRQLPYFFTNDPTNTHVVAWTTVRVFSYDSDDRGTKLTWHSQNDNDNNAGEIQITYNNGTESKEEQHIAGFFHHSPHPVTHVPYASGLILNGTFDIDDLGNKTVYSPGHLFVKLFIKYLYVALKQNIASQIKSKYGLVIKSIETGNLLHVLSRKTVYFKEMKSSGKMTEEPMRSAHREIGENGVVYQEKMMGCYREVSSQTYPLNPYLLQLIVRQTSNKVKHCNLAAYHPSYMGFLCPVSCFETKQVGRTTMLVKGIEVSVCQGLDPVFSEAKDCVLWKELNLSEAKCPGKHFVVVNEACIAVTKECFESIDLLRLKSKFSKIECFETKDKQQQCFILIRYKTGLLFKQLTKDVWVTPRDELFWTSILFCLRTKRELTKKFGYDYYTSYITDLNPYFMNNSAPKNILGINSLKNSVLAPDETCARYFLDGVSAYLVHKCENVVLPGIDELSKMFEIHIPRATVLYLSHKGMTQEDCIVRSKNYNKFDCMRFHTLRFKIVCDGPCTFHPVKGDLDASDRLVGTFVNHGESDVILEEPSQSLLIEDVTNKAKKIYFKKTPFRVVQFHLSSNLLSVCVERPHEIRTGDKLCSLHGQKGVLRIAEDDLPLLDETVRPDLIVNAYCMFRMTPGQILEGIEKGGGKDAETVRNSDGELIEGARAFYAGTLYYPIAYWSVEHMYAPQDCVRDKILNQAVKGRSRGGGMRLGNMEIYNGLRANGIASCCEEKMFEHGDATLPEYIPKSVRLVIEDAKFFKANIRYDMRPSVLPITNKNSKSESEQERIESTSWNEPCCSKDCYKRNDIDSDNSFESKKFKVE